MGHFYFTRHGQTVWNVENKLWGATDIELKQLGDELALELGRKIKEEGVKIDEILYSPLVRAKETARHISEVTGIPMREEMRLKEQNFGKYESTPRNGEEFKKAKQNFINHFEGGETMLHLCQRIYNLLDDIRKEADDKVYLLVAHNGISRVIQSYFYDMTNEEFAAFGIKNCELRKYEFPEQEQRMKLLVKQRVFSWTDSYDVYDENENAKYFVKAEFLSLGHRLHVYDMAGNELGLIKEKVMSLLPVFEIEVNGQTLGRIEKRFTLFRPKYDVEFNGWHVEGDFMGWNYDIYEACSPVVHITKELLRWGDTYVLDFANPADELMGLLLVITIDAANCIQNN